MISDEISNNNLILTKEEIKGYYSKFINQFFVINEMDFTFKKSLKKINSSFSNIQETFNNIKSLSINTILRKTFFQKNIKENSRFAFLPLDSKLISTFLLFKLK